MVREVQIKSKASVCQTCGNKGYEELLLCCSKCQISMKHKYCLMEIPEKVGKDFIYTCQQCQPSSAKQNSPEKVFLYALRSTFRQRKRRRLVTSSGSPVADRFVKDDLLEAHLNEYNQSTHCCDVNREGGQDESNVSNKEAKGVEGKEVQVELNTSDGPLENPLLKPSTEGKEMQVESNTSDGPLENPLLKPSTEVQTRDAHASQTLVLNFLAKDGSLEADLNENTRSPLCNVTRDGNQELKGRSGSLMLDNSDKSAEEAIGVVEGPAMQVVQAAQVDLNSGAGPLDTPSNQPFMAHPAYSRPIIEPAWRGFFEICTGKFWLQAHLSNKACLQVYEAAKLMPKVLSMNMMPRCDAWPKSFSVSAPTDENIALYFFPSTEWVVKPFDELVQNIMTCDLALKVLLENAELLIFSSNRLPNHYWRFNGKYYLWGVFRGRKDSSDNSLQNISAECSMSYSALGKNDKDYMESRQRSPLSPSSMSSSYGSDSPRSPLPQTKKFHHLTKSILADNTAKSGNDECDPKNLHGCLNEDKNILSRLADTFATGSLDASIRPALELFPLGVENMALATKMGASSGLHLELRLAK
ncbi:hypothetical protein IFM89_013382 [Coptis chinensis]|uniref:AIPP2-like SPOC-like domain-containing protein n=1 Tax=Coptis chinensis TaxID=261450 RepID=A0A835LUX4_9MAGN|nr:hypothetical protein IFM89_013382 [Coptis chinensis]